MESRIVIIDDDPTGCQTIRNVPVFLTWDEPTLHEALTHYRAFFILTNTRAMTAGRAGEVSAEVARNLKRANAGRYRLVLMSRGDSTLRGHLLPELSPLEENFGPYDGLILCPAFFEGNRYTIDDIHCMRTSKGLIPVTESEYARDAVFGYTHAALPEWIEEVSGGYFRSGRAISLRTETIRSGEQGLFELLMRASSMAPIIINALNYTDMERVDAAIRKAEDAGKRFLYRTAASMVRVRLGQHAGPPYRPGKSPRPGLVVVGSYTERTTAQLDALLRHKDLHPLEIDVTRILSPDGGNYGEELTEQLNRMLAHHTCVVYTSRTYALAGDASARQRDGARIASFIDMLVNRLTTIPGFIVSKGGITSYTVARYGLGVTQALVEGAVAEGVPVWKIGPDSPFSGIDYVVFPGNVGDTNTLAEVVGYFT